MNTIRSLRRAFILALSVSTMSASAQNQNTKSQGPMTATEITVQAAQQDPVQQFTFDYAFGDQAAAAMNLPGSTGKDWGIKDSMEGLSNFIKKNPGALKGKNVMVALCDCTLWDALMRKKKLTNMLLDAVGNGRIVVMGVSEKRTDGLSKMANDEIKSFVAKHKNVAIYGDSMMPIVAGETLDPKRDYIYPQTAAEFQYIVERANGALNAALKPAIPAKTAQPKH